MRSTAKQDEDEAKGGCSVERASALDQPPTCRAPYQQVNDGWCGHGGLAMPTGQGTIRLRLKLLCMTEQHEAHEGL